MVYRVSDVADAAGGWCGSVFGWSVACVRGVGAGWFLWLFLGAVLGEGGVAGAGGVAAAGDCVVVLLLIVLGLCPPLLWPGLGGLLVHRLWWGWLSLVAEVAGGDADGGVMLAMVFLMPLDWVM